MPTGRHHTLIVSRDKGGYAYGDCCKDWFVATHCELYIVHIRIERTQGTFHVVSNIDSVTPEIAEGLVDAWVESKITTIDLRKYSYRKKDVFKRYRVKGHRHD